MSSSVGNRAENAHSIVLDYGIITLMMCQHELNRYIIYIIISMNSITSFTEYLIPEMFLMILLPVLKYV